MKRESAKKCPCPEDPEQPEELEHGGVEYGRDAAKPRPLSVAISGIRGIPARYGGFETFAEELALRLTRRGHRVRVYGRRHVIPDAPQMHCGAEIVLLPAPRHKYLETPVHTLRSFLHLRRNPVDVVLVCNAANSPLLPLLKFSGMPVAVNLDGIERLRGKWNMIGRLWYRLGEICSVLFADAMISDAEVIKHYYLSSYRRNSAVLRYGYRERFEALVKKKVELLVECGEHERAAVQMGHLLADAACQGGELFNQLFKELKIAPGRYILYVSRLEPENNCHVVIQAHLKLPPEVRNNIPLVVLGDAPYAEAYKKMLRELADSAVIFAGFRFGAEYELLQLGTYLYVQATEVGGTHPALVESMGFGNCVLANGTAENIEVLGTDGLIYEKNSAVHLGEMLLACINRELPVGDFAAKARRAAETKYAWSKIACEYEDLFAGLAARFARLNKP